MREDISTAMARLLRLLLMVPQLGWKSCSKSWMRVGCPAPRDDSYLACAVKVQFLVTWGLSTRKLVFFWKTWASWGISSSLVFHGECKKGEVDKLVCTSNPLKSHTRGITPSVSALGEKPPSAMVPSILISKTGDMLVIGGAGGAWIISATAMVSEQVPHSNAFHWARGAHSVLNKRNYFAAAFLLLAFL